MGLGTACDAVKEVIGMSQCIKQRSHVIGCL